MCVHMYAGIHICVYVCMFICAQVCMCECVHMWVCVYMCGHVHMYAYVYRCAHMCAYTCACVYYEYLTPSTLTQHSGSLRSIWIKSDWPLLSLVLWIWGPTWWQG